ncbi:MAG: phosphodiester glycosidase family protein, partial [Actinomycetota bacterium]
MRLARAGHRTRHRYLLTWSLLLALIAAQTLASGSTWVAGVRVPKHYRVTAVQRVASGVWHIELKRRNREQVVNIARLERSSPHRLKIVLSNGLVAGPEPRTERTSRMCARVACLLAVNGDYFSDGVPVGGLVSEGEPIRSPADGRRQFSLAPDERPSIGSMAMPASLVTFHKRIPAGLKLLNPSTLEQRTTTIGGVNVPRPDDGIALFTPRWGPTTGTKTGFEVVARIVSPSGRLSSGVDTTLEIVDAHPRGGTIPKDGVVLSGRGDGAGALASLWNEVSDGRAERHATLRVAPSPNAVQSVAGKELLLDDGEIVAPRTTSRAPRTMIGWNAAGDLLLVTVDGRQPGVSYGMTLIEAADLMRRLGAVEALNLDGGGSTTFVKKGKVVNRLSSSGRRERAVAVAVAIVP